MIVSEISLEENEFIVSRLKINSNFRCFTSSYPTTRQGVITEAKEGNISAWSGP